MDTQQQRDALLAKLKARSQDTEIPLEIVKARLEENNSLCIPNCEICGGKAWIHVERERTDPNFGKLEPCPNSTKKHLTSGNSRYGLAQVEIDQLDWPLIKPKISDGSKAISPVRKALMAGFGIVFLWGDYGQAKTLLLKIAVAESLRNGKDAAYANLTDIMDDIRLAYDNDEAKMTELVRRVDWWTDLPVLAIDELDKANETQWVRERVHQLLDRRWSMAIRENTLTLIASNKSSGDLDGYLASRIEDGRFSEYMIHLDGPDGRKVMPLGHIF
jgi:ATPase family associated with various cellular activities (AAA)